MFFWVVLWVAYYIYVMSYLIWTQSQPTASFNGLTINNVPFYAAAIPQLEADDSEIYSSFDYWLWMSDYLIILLPFIVLGSLLLIVLFNQAKGGFFGLIVLILGIVFAVLEFFKAIYWTLFWANTSDPIATGCELCCGAAQFCMSHNPGDPRGTPTTQFQVAVVFAYLNAIFSILLIFFGSIVRMGKLDHTQVFTQAKKIPGSNVSAESEIAIPINDTAATNSLQRRATAIRSVADAVGGRAPPRKAMQLF
jgi:hypothetical protein